MDFSTVRSLVDFSAVRWFEFDGCGSLVRWLSGGPLVRCSTVAVRWFEFDGCGPLARCSSVAASWFGGRRPRLVALVRLPNKQVVADVGGLVKRVSEESTNIAD